MQLCKIITFAEVTPLSVVVERLSPKKGKPQSPSVSGKPEVASSSKKRTNISRKLSGSDKKTPATTSQKDTQDCPICSQAFHIDEIEVRHFQISFGNGTLCYYV